MIAGFLGRSQTNYDRHHSPCKIGCKLLRMSLLGTNRATSEGCGQPNSDEIDPESKI
jgi:hypothetical protein